MLAQFLLFWYSILFITLWDEWKDFFKKTFKNDNLGPNFYLEELQNTT